MEKYKSLIAAVKILAEAQQNIFTEERDSPAWEMLLRAKRYIHAQAAAEIRA